jgi:hypothetical protein
LVWAREHGCAWDIETCRVAAEKGNLDCLKWAQANGCEWDLNECSSIAIDHNHHEIIEWLKNTKNR